MPTSVLLAVLAAAGLLALAPALVRRYDATERQVAERAQSTARVLPRNRRRRTVPGRRPVNPPRVLPPTLRTAAPVSPAPTDEGQTAIPAPRSGLRDRDRVRDRDRDRARGRRPARLAEWERQRVLSVVPRSAPPVRRHRPRYSAAVYRRRRVLAALVLLNVVELIGVVAVGPGFWVGFAVTGTLLFSFVVYLRTLAVADKRRRRIEARRADALAAQQADVRREQERRAAARRDQARRMASQREALRRAAEISPSVSYRRAPRTRDAS